LSEKVNVKKLFALLRDLVSLTAPVEYEDSYEDGDEYQLFDLPKAVDGTYEVMVIEPHSLTEMSQVIQALWDHKAVLLNLTMMNQEQAQRAVDMIAGGSYAIGGYQERVGENIFLFTPICFQVIRQAGVVHEAPQPQMRSTYPEAPTLARTTQSVRVSHSSW
jgi:cell division inhibitor SepF